MSLAGDREKNALRFMRERVDRDDCPPVVYLHNPDEEVPRIFAALIPNESLDAAEHGLMAKGWEPMNHDHLDGDDELDEEENEWRRLTDMATKLAEPKLLERALAMTEGDRADSYGNVLLAAKRFAAIATGATGLAVKAEHFPLLMIALKLSRIAQAPQNWDKDSWTDIAGWAAVAEKLREQTDAHDFPLNHGGSD